MQNVNSMQVLYHEITNQFKQEIHKINNDVITKIYDIFSFYYLDFTLMPKNTSNSCNGTIKEKLFDFLVKNKFITFQIFNVNNMKPFPFEKTKLNDSYETSSNIVNIVICTEKKCYIIKNISYDLVKSILLETTISMINVSTNTSFFEFPDIKENNLANEEVTNFCFHMKNIRNNIYIENSIRPISSYIIRRHFYPSYYFKDKNFFNDNQTNNSFEETNKTLYNKIFDQENYDAIEKNKDMIISHLKDKSFNKNKTGKITTFSQKEFIILRQIYGNGVFSINLALHLKTLNIFAIKMINCPEEHEIQFCKNFRHRCFTPFYGFIKKDGKIIGFVYEFMSQGTLLNYIISNKDKISPLFIYNTIIRMFQGIAFLQKYKLVHRDLKPTNILINHDGLAYISDFETIRSIFHKGEAKEKNTFTNNIGSIIYSSPEQIFGNKVSFSTDVYSFGQILYFIFEKKDPYNSISTIDIMNMKKDEETFEMKNCSKNIQNLQKKCIKHEPKDRLSYSHIRQFIIDELDSLNLFESFLLRMNLNDNELNLIHQFFFEQLLIQSDDQANKLLFEINIINSLTKYFGNKKQKELDCSIGLVEIGKMYQQGNGVDKDYVKAREYFELAAKQNNSESYLKLGDLYYEGQGVEQNYIKSKEYYELSSKQNNSESYLKLGNLYYEGKGVNQNIPLAKEYYELSASLNNSSALLNLGIMYANEISVQKDYSKAKEYYELSAKQNNSNAFIALGNLYAFALGVKQDFSKAKEYYELSAAQNNSHAFLDIGNLYSFGLGVDQDYLRAKTYYERCGELDNSYGFLALGNLYANGLGVNQDYMKAKEYYEIAANKKNSIALFGLGILYANGLGVYKDSMRAEKYYELSAFQNKNNSNNSLVDIYVNSIGKENEYMRAKKCCELAGMQNNSDAIFFLGILYANGIGGKRDYLKAKEYYEIASKQNNSNALLYLGTLYANGLGVEQNYLKAKEYYELSANLNNSDAVLSLGDLYEFGHGVYQDYNKAKEYYELAGKNKNSYALFRLGDFYEYGKGVKQDYNKAKEYYELSAKQNNSDALLKLGKIYSERIIVKQDYLRAKHYYELSAEQNNSKALVELGKMYQQGNGVDKDYVKAREYFELAAKQNNSESYLKLGDLYYEGQGVEQNYIKSKEYYELSSKQNNSESYLKLGNLYYEGKGVNQNTSFAKEYYELSGRENNSTAILKLAYLLSIDINSNKNMPRIIKLFQQIIQINNENTDLSRRIRQNGHYFRALNDLGLINYFEFNDMQSAIDLVKEAALNEYPFAQNNLGILYQFYLDNEANAEYMFKRSSKHNFFLADYNLGYMYERNKNVAESIKYYKKVLDDENKPLIYRNEIITDERIEKSKKFVSVLTNLKLTIHYLKENNKNMAKNYFIRALSCLKIGDKEQIFNCSKKHTNDNLFECIQQNIFNYTDFNLTNYRRKNLKKQFLIQKNRKNNKMMEYSKQKCMKDNINECVFSFDVNNNQTFSDYQIDLNFNNPSDLFDFAMSNYGYFNLFFEKINDIISNMIDILYERPHHILFGRLNCRTTHNIDISKKYLCVDINNLFYEGFGF